MRFVIHFPKTSFTIHANKSLEVNWFIISQVISVVSSHPDLLKISFVGHSLGGLIARYAVALLYQQNVTPKHGEENGENDGDESNKSSLSEKPRGHIAGLEPMNFITFATPHLGSRGHKQVI